MNLVKTNQLLKTPRKVTARHLKLRTKQKRGMLKKRKQQMKLEMKIKSARTIPRRKMEVN
jgi:hypothetical protein